MSTYPHHWRWHAGEVDPGDAVICDLDGVLADASGRQHLLRQKPANWRAFFDAAGEDALLEPTVDWLAQADPSYQIVLVTGRPMRIQRITLDWLKKYDVRWDLLIMRESGNYGQARAFKQRTVGELRDHGFHLLRAIEDDEHICAMYKAEGLQVTYVPSGYYENRVTRFPSDRKEAGE